MASRSFLSTRNSRSALKASDAPVWEVISPGLRLGYRRGRGTRGRGGTWLVAGHTPDGRRKQARLGFADDIVAADGTRTLTCEQAKSAARAWIKAVRAGVAPSAGLTVDDVLDRYFDAKTTEGMKSLYDARSRAKTHIRPALGKILVTDLSVERLRRWRDSMVEAPRRLRTSKFAAQPNVQLVNLEDPETARRRRDTANRTLTTLKAALNWAHHYGHVDDDSAWRLVKPFKYTTASRVRFLQHEEQERLLAHAPGDVHQLIAAALMTGARFSELARLRVADFDAANGSIFIGESKSGRARHVPLTAGGLALFKQAAAGQEGSAPLLRRGAGRWTPASYRRDFELAVRNAGLPAITFHELRHSYASTMVRNGAIMAVVAEALGHRGTRMVEKHYAHLAPSFVAEQIRRFAPDLASRRD